MPAYVHQDVVAPGNSTPPVFAGERGSTTPPAPRVLLVTTRNLSAATGEWRLVANRAAALASGFNIGTDVLYLRPGTAELALFDGERWSQQVHGIPVSDRPGLRWCSAIREGRRFISEWLRRNVSGMVVVSGSQLYLTPLAIPKDRLIVDLHGTLREWVEGDGRTPRDRALRLGYPLVAFAERRALKGARGALVVSTELATYAVACGVRKVWKIPCGLLRSSVMAEPIAGREKWRRRLSIPPDATAFVYSGSLSKWQCVREAVDLFVRLREIWPGRCRLVVMTPQIDKLPPLLAGLETVAITAVSVPAEEIGSALSACDLGLLIRDDNSTNHSAWPNKLAEYLAAGLFVITSPGLTDPAQFVLRHRVGALIDPGEIRAGVTPDRAKALMDAYHGRGPQQRCSPVVNAAALDEMTMERLVAAFAESLVSQ
jgi:glycosyltransferase involved in cell wall biosynthesis